jgi:hypothetical protein
MLRIVLDGAPGPVSGRFLEVEDALGKSVRVGQWHPRPDGLIELRLEAADICPPLSSGRHILDLARRLEDFAFHPSLAGNLSRCRDWDELKARIEALVYTTANHETQATINEWQRATFPAPTPAAAALRCLEEVVELCVEVGCDGTSIASIVAGAISAALEKRKGPAHAPAEMADVYITLAQLAQVAYQPGGPVQNGYRTIPIDIQAEVGAKMKINRGRQWGQRPDGSFQHVEAQEVSSEVAQTMEGTVRECETCADATTATAEAPCVSCDATDVSLMGVFEYTNWTPRKEPA